MCVILPTLLLMKTENQYKILHVRNKVWVLSKLCLEDTEIFSDIVLKSRILYVKTLEMSLEFYLNKTFFSPFHKETCIVTFLKKYLK